MVEAGDEFLIATILTDPVHLSHLILVYLIIQTASFFLTLIHKSKREWKRNKNISPDKICLQFPDSQGAKLKALIFYQQGRCDVGQSV